MHTPAPTLGKAGLWVLLCGMLLPQIDFSIVNVALDAMGLSLHITPVQLALTVTVYGLCFAIALAPGSLLGDRYGRRKIFMLGIAGFGLASLACGLASTLTTLLVARAIQGITAALIVPQVLATIHVTVSGEHHSRAGGYYSAIGGLSFVIGQVSGGLLVSADIAGLGWRSVFLINLPLAVILLLIVPRCIPETRSEHSHSVDWAGA
ncbi:MAG: MFS transporter, partial [Aeromonas sp.]